MREGSSTASVHTSRARRQPAPSTTSGTNSPAITPPSGTPACLIENSRLRMPGGENFCRISLPAGLAAPLLRPMTKQAARATRWSGISRNTSPMAPMTTVNCSVRMPPIRLSNGDPNTRMPSPPSEVLAVR